MAKVYCYYCGGYLRAGNDGKPVYPMEEICHDCDSYLKDVQRHGMYPLLHLLCKFIEKVREP